MAWRGFAALYPGQECQHSTRCRCFTACPDQILGPRAISNSNTHRPAPRLTVDHTERPAGPHSLRGRWLQRLPIQIGRLEDGSFRSARGRACGQFDHVDLCGAVGVHRPSGSTCAKSRCAFTIRMWLSTSQTSDSHSSRLLYAPCRPPIHATVATPTPPCRSRRVGRTGLPSPASRSEKRRVEVTV